jgi:hypothetical protein
MATQDQAQEQSKQPRRIFQALTPQCPPQIATVHIPAKDGQASICKVKEMDRLGRFEVKEGELYYDEHVAALRLFCVRKPGLLKELRPGVDADPSASAHFGPRKADKEVAQDAKREAAEATLKLKAATSELEEKDGRIAALQSEIAELKKALKK